MKKILNFNMQTLKNADFIEDIILHKWTPYFVGGCVRDFIMGMTPNDIDIIVVGCEKQELLDLLKKYGKPDLVGESFAVIKFHHKGEIYDIATPRTEKKTEKGHKGFEVISNKNITLEMDLFRRDITINSIAMDLDGNFIDPFGGINDIKNKIIKITNPDAFSDDPLRILRSIRFCGRFGFKIDKNTINMMTKHKDDIKELSTERIRDEFKKSIETAKYPANVLDMFLGYDFFDYIFPNYIINRNFETTNNWIIQLTSLLIKNDDKKIKKLIELKYEADEVRDILFLKTFLTLSLDNFLELSIKWKISRLGKNKIDSDVLMYFGQSFGMNVETIKAFIKFKPSVNGDEIMKEFGIKGRAVGEKIKELETENFLKILNNK